MATVFLPDTPSVATGRHYLVDEDQVVRRDVPLDAYCKKLCASGDDSTDWLKALSEAKRVERGTAPVEKDA